MSNTTERSLESYLDTSMYVGQRERHEYCPFCGERIRGKGFVVTRTKNGFFLWCFKCHVHRHLTRDGLPLSSVKRFIKERNKSQAQVADVSVEHNVVSLPRDFTTDIPPAGIAWLRKGGVTFEEMKQYRLGYSPELDRVILPIWGEEGLLYWQGRALVNDGTKPKYINVKTKRSHVFFVVGTNSNMTVLVEDILSALAIARAGYIGVALLGSYVGTDVQEVIKTHKVRVWLDPDKRKDCIRFAKRLSMYNIDASPIVFTDKDPKEYTTAEIKEILERKS